jgi:hypothetical protein
VPSAGQATSSWSTPARSRAKPHASRASWSAACTARTWGRAWCSPAASPSSLWEGEGEPIPAAGAAAWQRFTGYTDNYLRVETAVPAGVSLANRVTPARLCSVHGELLRAEIAGHALAA